MNCRSISHELTKEDPNYYIKGNKPNCKYDREVSDDGILI
jgi:hypothetical protein